jgi:hypothetical protein
MAQQIQCLHKALKPLRRVILSALMFALCGCDDSSQTTEETWGQAIAECRENAIEKKNDPEYILACMAAAGFEPLSVDDAADICFSHHIYDTPGCWRQRERPAS